MKTNSRSKGMVPLINLGNREWWAVSFMSWLLYPDVKSSQQPLNRKLGGSRAGLDVLEKTKIFFPRPGSKPSVIQPTNRGNNTIYTCITLSIASMFSFQLIYNNELPNNVSVLWKVLAHQWMVLSAQKLFSKKSACNHHLCPAWQNKLRNVCIS